MKHGSLFSGVGGFDLAAEWLGWENVFHCEINEFGRKVLNYHFPKSISYEDITKTDFTIHRGDIDVLSGGFPCQPFSMAGKRKGKEDERHLWPQMLRAIREIRPKYIVGENVYGLINWDGGLFFDEAQSDLEAEGYEVIPVVLPAVSVNAPHRRDRVWFIASNTYSDGLLRGNGENEKHTGEGGVNALGNSEHGLKHGDAADTDLPRCKTKREQPKPTTQNKRTQYSSSRWERFPTQFPVCSGDDGLPTITHGETISKEHNMDRTELIVKCLNEGRIEVDSHTGKIYSRMIRGHEGEKIELKGSDCNGYVVHSLKYNGIKKQVKAHQVIWISVNGIYDKNKLQIDHINRDKKDNRIENLRLVTPKTNNANQNRWKGNFTEEQKDLMFLLHYEGHMSFRELAEDFGCSKSRVHQIVSEHKFNELDGITFSKWRNESIKAYGNAIVPQVAYEIFKVINNLES